jgi:hypothetical protein
MFLRGYGFPSFPITESEKNQKFHFQNLFLSMVFVVGPFLICFCVDIFRIPMFAVRRLANVAR